MCLELERLRKALLMQRDELCGAARCIPSEFFLSVSNGAIWRDARGDKNSNSMLLGRERAG